MRHHVLLVLYMLYMLHCNTGTRSASPSRRGSVVSTEKLPSTAVPRSTDSWRAYASLKLPTSSEELETTHLQCLSG